MVADRSYNGVDSRLYREWRFSKPARAILAHIIAISPNQYGVYDPSPYGEVMDWWSGIFDRQAIADSWTELIAKGVIRVFRGDECLWLVKKFKREIANVRTERNRKGVVNFIANYPEIEKDFKTLYGIQVTPAGTQVTGMVTPVLPESPKTLIPDSDSDTDSESNTLLPGIFKTPLAFDPSQTELEVLAVLKSIPRWKPAFNPSTAVKQLRTLAIDYPRVDMLETMKVMRDWLADKPTKTAGALRMRNFCKTAAKSAPDAEVISVKPGYLQQANPREFKRDRSGFWIDEHGQAWDGDKQVNSSQEDIQRLGDRMKSGELLGGMKQ